jgi:hypothetical protein
MNERSLERMSTQVGYTKQEWQLLRNAPVLAGFAVIAADENGTVGTLKEIVSLARGYVGAEQHYPDNELIQRVLQSLSEQSEEDIVSSSGASSDQSSAGATGLPEEPLAAALAACRHVSDLLATKAPAPVAEGYKRWVLEVALGTARAAKEGGGPFGIGGTRVSPAEVTTLDMLAGTLGISWSLNPEDTRPTSPWRGIAIALAGVLAVGGIVLGVLALARARKQASRTQWGQGWRTRR